MKLSILAVLFFIFASVSSVADAGVWVPNSSGGGSSPSCYLVIFNAGTYGTQQLIGTGVVGSGVFSGFLKFTANPQNNGTTYQTVCGTSGQCAWYYAGSYYGGNYYVVSVSSLPIYSASPVACW